MLGIAITVATAGKALSLGGVQGLLLASGSGAVAGAVATGSLRGAVTGALAAAAFYGIGSAFEAANCSGCFKAGKLKDTAKAVKTALHATTGGLMNVLNGGQFGHGFVAAGIIQSFADPISGFDNAPERVVAAAIVGGTASEITGGKFANGAVTAAFTRAFNDEMHRRSIKERLEHFGNFVLDEGGSIVFRTATTIGGAGQILLGGALCATAVGCAAGGPLAVLGASNIQEGLTGEPGFVRSQLTEFAGGPAGNLAVDAVNIVSSGAGLLRPVLQPGTFKLFNYIRSDYVSAYQTATQVGLTAEVGAGTLSAVDTLDRYYGN